MDRDILFMSVDLGTSFIKTGVYDTDGNCLAGVSVPVKDERPEPGVVIQRAESLFDAVLRCLKETTASVGEAAASRIEAMAFTGQMAGFMGVDKDWRDVTTWSCFIDGRFVPYADRQMSLYRDKFLHVSGTNSPLMAPKIEWFRKEFPAESAKIEKYMMISSYVIGRLGHLPIEEAVMDHSFLSWTGLGDLSDQTWSEEICRLTGVDEKYLPRIVKSNEVCGYLAEDMAAYTGLKSGILLVSGAGDKVAGCVGASVLEPGEAIFEAGSYGAVSCTVEDFRMNEQDNYYDIIPAAVNHLYAHKYIPGSGITLDWFVDNFMQGMDKKEAFAKLEERVPQIAPGCEGLMAIGLLGGNAMPFDGNMRGMFAGHTWSHKTEHFYRALLESFAYDLALTLDSVTEKYPEYGFQTLKIIGGGAKSKAWMQILADVTGREFKRLNREDVALWGAAVLAGNAVGVFPDLKKTAQEHISVQETIKPDASRYAKYRELKQRYQECVIKFHDFYKNI